MARKTKKKARAKAPAKKKSKAKAKPKVRAAAASKKVATVKHADFDPIINRIFKNGLHHAIASACGIKRQAIEQWKQVPWNRVLIVEKITGVSRFKIRPDIYGTP